MVILDPLLHHLLLLRTKTNVPDFATGFAHRQNQNRVAFASIALGTSGFMTDYAFQQRTAQQFTRGKVFSQFIAPPHGVFVFHYVK